MSYKILISFLLFAVFNLFISCTTYEIVTPTEFKDIKKDDKPDKLVIKTDDGQIFNLSNSNYFIKNDSLFCQGTITIDERWIPFEGKVPYDEIKEIEYFDDKINWTYRLSISEYKKIEDEGVMPIEIFVIKNDSTKYYFKADDYYLNRDTLVGTGELFLPEKKKISNNVVPLSDIESLEYEYVSTWNRIFRGVVFFSSVFIVFLIIVGVTWHPSWG